MRGKLAQRLPHQSVEGYLEYIVRELNGQFEGVPSGQYEKIDFNEIGDPGPPGTDQIRLFAENQNGFTVLETETAEGRVFRLGQDTYRIARNTTGATIAAGDLLYFSGSTGNAPNVGLARADSMTTMPCIGMAAIEIADNAFGIVLVIGREEGINTSAFVEGDVLYVSDSVAGGLTSVRPSYPSLKQAVATVEVSGVGNGALLVNVTPVVQTVGGALPFTATGDGATVAFDIGIQIDAVHLVLWFEDGIPQRPTTDFTVSGTTVTRTTAPLAGAAIHGIVLTP